MWVQTFGDSRSYRIFIYFYSSQALKLDAGVTILDVTITFNISLWSRTSSSYNSTFLNWHVDSYVSLEYKQFSKFSVRSFDMKSICWICHKVAVSTHSKECSKPHVLYFYICRGIDGCSRTYCNFYSFKKHRGNLHLLVLNRPQNNQDSIHFHCLKEFVSVVERLTYS